MLEANLDILQTGKKYKLVTSGRKKKTTLQISMRKYTSIQASVIRLLPSSSDGPG